eukprot:1055823_1
MWSLYPHIAPGPCMSCFISYAIRCDIPHLCVYFIRGVVMHIKTSSMLCAKTRVDHLNCLSHSVTRHPRYSALTTPLVLDPRSLCLNVITQIKFSQCFIKLL